jgi:hypothetical protein
VGKLLLVILVLGVVIYVTVRLIERRRGNGGGGSTSRLMHPKSPPNRPMGPDDDPDFLRDLNRRRPKRPRPEDG